MTVDLETKLAAVQAYYGEATWWDRVAVQGLTPSQIDGLYSQLPASSFSVDVTPSGLVLGRQYENPFELPVIPGSDWDSNIPGGAYEGGNTFTGSIPGSIIVDPTTGLPVRMQGGATTSTGTQLPAIVDRLSLAVAGVNIGAKLGLAIDSLLYEVAPSFWDENLPALNPETWSSLVGVNPVGDFFLRTLFGITDSGMTAHVSEDMLAYYYMLLRDKGAFGIGGGTVIPAENVVVDADWTGLSKSLMLSQSLISYTIGDQYYEWIFSGGHTLVVAQGDIQSSIWYPLCVSDVPIPAAQYKNINLTTGNTVTAQINSSPITRHNKTYYIIFSSNSRLSHDGYTGEVNRVPSSGLPNPICWDIANIIYTGVIDDDTLPGTSQLPGSTQYPPTTITGGTLPEVKQQLRQAYPELFDGSITEQTMQEDGTVTETTYVPIPWVTEGLRPENPTTLDERTQEDLDLDPGTGDEVLPTTPQDEPTDVPPTGEGDTPPIITPTGSASSLWAVYNPTQAQLNSFGSWLWSSDFVEQIKKLFADPMQAIIGVHKVFASPSTGGSQTIKCGYLDSGVSASVVTNQYTTIDCGSAKLREYFGNVFDYEPYTKVSLFLPFIGVVPLNVSEVMRSTISVKYRVDVITGACLAEVSVSRDGAGGVLYTYGGSAIVTYPISSGSYVGAVQAALSTAIGIGLAASGGASIGAVAGLTLSGLSGAKTQVQHSGQFSGSSGAMGGKKPYLIVTRPQTYTPTKINEYKGLPSTSIGKLSKYTGFVRVNEVHLTSTKAYDNEIQEIESLLKSGVII